jgi:HAD superfamily hydrolase (TIGR01484 family)
MQDIRLLLADVDGTLITPERLLTPRAREAARALRANGIELAITSGRPPRGMAMLVEPLELTTPVAAFNGGMLVTPDLRTVIEARTLPRTAAAHVVDTLLAAGVDVWVYRGNDWFVRDTGSCAIAARRTWIASRPPCSSLRPW